MGDKLFWLISVPVAHDPSIFRTQEEKTRSVAKNYAFRIPELRVGTLDMLMTLSDDLARIDTFIEGTCRKITSKLLEILEGGKETTSERVLNMDGASIEDFVQQFRWDEEKYSAKRSLKELVDILASEVSGIDDSLRTKASEYGAVSQALQQQERFKTGALNVRQLNGIVMEKHWIESEYLTTLILAIPKQLKREWDENYAKLCVDFVVPESSNVIDEDLEFFLVNVVLFRKKVDDFKNECRKSKFIIRDFKYTAGAEQTDEATFKKLGDEKEDLKRKFVHWVKTSFRDTFAAWVHIKAIRLYVESVLRYGVREFVFILTAPNKKNEQKVRSILFELYKHLGSAIMASANDAEETEKFYPYVYLPIGVDWYYQSRE